MTEYETRKAWNIERTKDGTGESLVADFRVYVSKNDRHAVVIDQRSGRGTEQVARKCLPGPTGLRSRSEVLA